MQSEFNSEQLRHYISNSHNYHTLLAKKSKIPNNYLVPFILQSNFKQLFSNHDQPLQLSVNMKRNVSKWVFRSLLSLLLLFLYLLIWVFHFLFSCNGLMIHLNKLKHKYVLSIVCMSNYINNEIFYCFFYIDVNIDKRRLLLSS